LDASFKCREPKYITQVSQEFTYSIIYKIAEVTISIHRVPTVGKQKPFHFDFSQRSDFVAIISAKNNETTPQPELKSIAPWRLGPLGNRIYASTPKFNFWGDLGVLCITRRLDRSELTGNSRRNKNRSRSN
jgi:hypothetical protein